MPQQKIITLELSQREKAMMLSLITFYLNEVMTGQIESTNAVLEVGDSVAEIGRRLIEHA
jgi:hypothetical protein